MEGGRGLGVYMMEEGPGGIVLAVSSARVWRGVRVRCGTCACVAERARAWLRGRHWRDTREHRRSRLRTCLCV